MRTDRQTDRRAESGHADRRKVDRQTDGNGRTDRKWTDRRRMDGQAFMTQLIVTFRNFANVLKIMSEC